MTTKLAIATILSLPTLALADDITDAATNGLQTLSGTVTALGVVGIGIAVAFAVARVSRKAVNKV